MEIIVFSETKSVIKAFSGLSIKWKFGVSFMKTGELKKGLACIALDSLVYLDVSGMDDAALKKALRLLSGNNGLRYVVVDPKNSIKDAGALFHGGACDYICREILQAGLTEKRIRCAALFRSGEAPGKAPEDAGARSTFKPSGRDWKEIRPGQEYTFCFMFIELDNLKESKKTFGDANLRNPIEPFLRHVERSVTPAGGKIWMWTEYGAIALFPFDGRRCDAVLACFKMMLGRKVFSIEESGFNAMVSYRIALHIGNTVYRLKGETGMLVADSLNSIFNLGQKFARPGHFYLTGEVFAFAPAALGDFFVPAGSYEGREILRMRLPL
ncbi:MAG TPA: hypothetical protein VLM75_12910 [Spirochaetota bacterium]|nr:hypothetical protein [Spirochaetota bacterium]